MLQLRNKQHFGHLLHRLGFFLGFIGVGLLFGARGVGLEVGRLLFARGVGLGVGRLLFGARGVGLGVGRGRPEFQQIIRNPKKNFKLSVENFEQQTASWTHSANRAKNWGFGSLFDKYWPAFDCNWLWFV